MNKEVPCFILFHMYGSSLNFAIKSIQPTYNWQHKIPILRSKILVSNKNVWMGVWRDLQSLNVFSCITLTYQCSTKIFMIPYRYTWKYHERIEISQSISEKIWSPNYSMWYLQIVSKSLITSGSYGFLHKLFDLKVIPTFDGGVYNTISRLIQILSR